MYEQNKTLFKAILQNMVDAVMVIAPEDHVISYVNLAWEKLTGYTNNEAVDRAAFFTESELTPHHIIQNIWTALQAGKVGHGTLIGKRIDGARYEVEASVAPVWGEHGEILWYIATLRDVTETRKMEAHNVGFLADAANDLRNPMSSLKLRLYLLSKTPDRYQEHVAAMESLIEQIDVRVNDLVLLSTLSHDKPSGERKRVNLNDVIKRVTWANWPLAHDKGLTLTFTIAPTPLIVLADSDQMERMVVNLISNALSFTPSGGKIELTATQSANEIIVTITDTGIGIAPETLPFIFEQFYRLVESNCSVEATGMGLAIVKAIVDQHGGRIEVESVEGQGTTFRVYLPATAQY